MSNAIVGCVLLSGVCGELADQSSPAAEEKRHELLEFAESGDSHGHQRLAWQLLVIHKILMWPLGKSFNVLAYVFYQALNDEYGQSRNFEVFMGA